MTAIDHLVGLAALALIALCALLPAVGALLEAMRAKNTNRRKS